MSHFPHFYVALQIRYKIRMLQLLKGEKTKVNRSVTSTENTVQILDLHRIIQYISGLVQSGLVRFI